MGLLEGWVAGRPVLGRWLDGPCDDFTAEGVDLDHLYHHLLIDPAWIQGGLSALSEAYSEATGKLRRQLGFDALGDREFEEEFMRSKVHSGKGGRALVDFGDLSSGMQASLLNSVSADSEGRILREILELNPLLNRWRTIMRNGEELLKRNREVSINRFGPGVKAGRMHTLIRAAAARLGEPSGKCPTGQGNVRTLVPLLAETVSPSHMKLLYL